MKKLTIKKKNAYERKSGANFEKVNSTLVELTINSTASIIRNYNVNSTLIELRTQLHSDEPTKATLDCTMSHH